MDQLQTEPQAQEKARPKNIKKVLIILAISLIILLPTIFAVILTLYSEIHDDPVAFAGVEVVLYDEKRNELFRESGDNMNSESDSLVKILCAVHDNREKATSGSNMDDTAKPLITSVTRDGITTELTCYFSFYSGQSFCIDSAGERYVIPDMYSEYFTHSIFAEPLYAAAYPPTLNTFDGGKILPQEVKWNYLNESSQWFSSLLPKTADPSVIYDCTGGISLSFSQAPSNCTAKLYEQNEEIYSGDIDGISSVSLSKDVVRVSITATWDKQSGGAYYGTQTYNFFMRVHNKATFTVSSTTISANRPVLVCADNVENLSALIFTSDDTSFKPQFHLRGNTAFALIPYPADASQNQLSEFCFTLTYGIATQTFVLSCDSSESDVTPEVCELFGINLSYFNTTVNQIFLRENYAEPDAEKFILGHAFGESITLGESNAPSPFTEYLSISGHGNAVKSAYAGKVAFVGSNAQLGNYVIIDLGLDVKLWYCFLGETYVKTGDIIAMGEIIGTTSTIPLRDDGADGFAFIFSYLDYIVAPEFIFESDFSVIQ